MYNLTEERFSLKIIKMETKLIFPPKFHSMTY